MSNEQVPVILAVLAGLSVAIAVVGIFRANRSRPGPKVHWRIEHFATQQDANPLVKSFAQRVLQPALKTVLRAVVAVLPMRIMAAIDETIEAAGRRTSVSRFLTIWLIGGVGIPLGVALLVIIATGRIGLAQLLPITFWAGAALYLPWTALRRKAKQRIKEISRDLPDAIDLIITNVEAGLGLQAAMLVVAEKFHGPVGEEFGRTVREVSLGAERGQALADMATRTRVPEMRLFTRAVAQAEQTGISVARVLRNHSAEVREKRRQFAREQAAKIPVKLTFPTVLIMFPTLFLLILGPVALNIMNEFGK
ncbi:MAG: type II secretion system F family protein [Dehalococcoidia bacterium]|nr:MAG: type II secretion system F family protein [Dehalococcoidia bacterium]